MDSYNEDSHDVHLKSALDLDDLKAGQGVDFEVDEDELKKFDEEDTLLDCYDKNQVAAQICTVSDEEEEDEDDDNKYDMSQLKKLPMEMERLYKKIIKLPNSDITPHKDGGVLKQIKLVGVGSIVPENSLVTIHYSAHTDVGQPPYDSSRLRGQSFKLRLGKSEGLLGLELAILSMKKGELSRFLIRHDYAFGKMGCPPRIPPEATIIMDVELLNFVEQEGVDDYYSLTPEERRKLVFADIEKVARAANSEGKEYFALKNFHKAYGKFRQSMRILEDYSCKNEVEEKNSNKWKVKAYVNCAICNFNLNQFGRVISFCHLTLQIDRKNVKALYYMGKAQHAVGNFGKSEHFLKAARNEEPANVAVSKALKSLAKSKRDHEVFERQMCQRMFKNTSLSVKEENNGEDKKSEEITAEEQEDNNCSERFKEIAQSALQTFNNDRGRIEMQFPPMAMNVAEIAFIVETAESLGLGVRSRGTGNALRHEIFKKPSK